MMTPLKWVRFEYGDESERTRFPTLPSAAPVFATQPEKVHFESRFPPKRIERFNLITTCSVKLSAVSLTIVAAMFYIPTLLVVSLTSFILHQITAAPYGSKQKISQNQADAKLIILFLLASGSRV